MLGEKSRGSEGGGAMEGLEGEEVERCGPGGESGPEATRGAQDGGAGGEGLDRSGGPCRSFGGPSGR